MEAEIKDEIKSEIKQFIKKGIGKNNKFKFSGKQIVQRKLESDSVFKRRLQHELFQYRLANNKEDYTTLKTFDEYGNKRVLVYTRIVEDKK